MRVGSVQDVLSASTDGIRLLLRLLEQSTDLSVLYYTCGALWNAVSGHGTIRWFCLLYFALFCLEWLAFLFAGWLVWCPAG